MSVQNKLAYPIKEACALLGIPRTRGYQLIAEGHLKTYMVGRRRMCSHAALVACQKAMESGALAMGKAA